MPDTKEDVNQELWDKYRAECAENERIPQWYGYAIFLEDRLAQLEAGWVRVDSGELPERGQEVWLCQKNKNALFNLYSSSAVGPYGYEDLESGEYIEWEPTHWMPITPPGGE